MSEMFYAKMDEFQQDLQKNSAANGVPQARDGSTRNAKQAEDGRILHGVPEVKTEDLAARVTTVFADHLDLPNFSSSSIKASYRLGRPSEQT
ncbi:unnamed protein product, partial [Iphiclides podalirius]